MNKSFIILLCIILGACSTKQSLSFKKSDFSELKNWNNDLHFEALEAFSKSCALILKIKSKDDFFINPNQKELGKIKDWQEICKKIPTNGFANKKIAQTFFETNFIPHLIVDKKDKTQGFITGYYEPTLKGSLTKKPPFVYPIYKMPQNSVTINLQQFDSKNKNGKISGIIKKHKILPFYTREQIENGALENQNLEIVWTDSLIDNFILHIQGSGKVILENGKALKLTYSGQNGYDYYPIGKFFKEKKLLGSKPLTMSNISDWLYQNPKKINDILNLNQSYIFFNISKNEADSQKTAALTPMRSLAVDKRYIPLIAPIWIETEHPLKDGSKLYRLMIAQDTGGAINGVIYADFFWGQGAKAKKYAHIMQSKGSYWILIPKSALR